jgi:hypothetical protein
MLPLPLVPKLCLGTHLAAKLQLGGDQVVPDPAGFQAKQSFTPSAQPQIMKGLFDSRS